MANKSNLNYPRSQKIKSNKDFPQVEEVVVKKVVKKKSFFKKLVKK